MATTRYLCKLTVDSHFMHVYSCEVLTLFDETLLREKKNTGFRILLDFSQKKES